MKNEVHRPSVNTEVWEKQAQEPYIASSSPVLSTFWYYVVEANVVFVVLQACTAATARGSVPRLDCMCSRTQETPDEVTGFVVCSLRPLRKGTTTHIHH